MSGTTPGDNAGSDPERDPFSQPRDPRPWEKPASSEPGPPSAWDPTGGVQPAGPPQPPRSIVIAVRLMYVGAIIYAFNLLLLLIAAGPIRDSIRDAAQDVEGELTADDIEATVNTIFGTSVALVAIAVLLWVWMAWANKRGRTWARIIATILGGLNVIFNLFSLTGAFNISTLITLATVVIAVVALYMLYKPESSEYYRAMSAKIY